MRVWVVVLLGIMLLGWVAFWFVRKPSQPDSMTPLIDVQEPLNAGKAESSVVGEEDMIDDVDLPVIGEAQVEELAEPGDEVEETSQLQDSGGEANGKLAPEIQDGTLAEPDDTETYAVVSGLVVFGAMTEENRLTSSRGGLSEEDRDQLVAGWKERGLPMVALESIAMTRPGWAVMQVTWNSVDGSEVQARSHHTERRGLWEGQTDIDNLARGTSGVRLRLWMKEGSRRCDVDSSTWTNGIPDQVGDLGGMKVAEDGATTHYQFHWSGEDYSVLMSVEERAREALAEE